MQQENMCCYKKSMSCREVVTRHLRIFVSDGMANEREEIRRSRIETLRDDRPLLNNGNGFTLIELLVVVLIIGILAAVALPQYQKAVWKSRLTQAKTMAKSLAEAQEIFYLANGTYTQEVDALSLDLPGTTCAVSGNYIKCTTSWGDCQTGTVVPVAECFIYKNGSRYLGFTRWLEHSPYPKVRSCIAYSTNLSDIANQTCKSETGRTAPNNSFDNYLQWHYH